MGLFKSYSEREVKKVMPIVNKINDLEKDMLKLSEADLRKKTDDFKERLKNGETLDDILPEAFAVVREASKRVLGMRHFDVQLIGGIILHQGRIAEMKTGEGKTLVATLPVYLNALEGKGVHVVTVNDYLAKRDSEWMGKLYKFLGLSVGLVLPGLDPRKKQEAYNCDITYGTNNEFGFDYLRDNMAIYKEQLVQRTLHYAIVDEIDSILIDEARTPLIISGQGAASSDLYKKADKFVRGLQKKVIVEENVKDFDQAEDNEKYDYIVDLKAKTASLTQKGIEKAEKAFDVKNFNDIENADIVHHVHQALRAYGVMQKDTDYIVKDGEVLIVDEFTGRIMYGRRYSDGLHQAIEAKENVKIAEESKTLATITFQNYFKMYNKLSGMTGTAMTEENEFREIYNLDVIEIPTNKEMIREDEHDVVYKTEKAKFNAVIEDIKECHEKGEPVLVGTVSVEKSEKLSKMLKEAGIKHTVLNAKYHEQEAAIVAQAGKLGAVTIATNMAGRGTDIMLGGNSEFLALEEMRNDKVPENIVQEANTYYETDDQDILRAREKFKELKVKYDEQIKEEKKKVIEAGGLKIIGTERHESRRIDNQLRGRSGRQGDPGKSQFYISLEDDVVKLFGGDRLNIIYNTLKVDENLPIKMKSLSKLIETAQKRVEGRNFSIRKSVLQYDDVMNVQRNEIYNQRRQVLDGMDLSSNISKMIDWAAERTVYAFDESDGSGDNQLNVTSLAAEIQNQFGISMFDEIKENSENIDAIVEILKEKAHKKYQDKEAEVGSTEMRENERVVMLHFVDEKWMDHIDAMDDLKNGIGLQGYGQKDPVVQYRLVGTDMFDEMIEAIRMDVVKFLMNMRVQKDLRRAQTVKITNAALSAIRSVDGGQSMVDNPDVDRTVRRETPKIGRNDPCYCGSGKKYKNCHGKNA